MIRRIFVVAMLLSLFALGCSSATTPTSEKDIEAFFAGVSPTLTGEVGSYTFTGKDGTIETGTLIRDELGNITHQPDRGASVYSNDWFTIGINYLNPRYYTGMGLPVYYIGDCFDYEIEIDYKKGFDLNQYPLAYTSVKAVQMYYPSMVPLPGASTEVWNPLGLDPYDYKVLTDNFCIVGGTTPGNDCTWVEIWFECVIGECHYMLAGGVAGLWDP